MKHDRKRPRAEILAELALVFEQLRASFGTTTAPAPTPPRRNR